MGGGGGREGAGVDCGGHLKTHADFRNTHFYTILSTVIFVMLGSLAEC